jgi:hypothetical protein
MIEQRNGVGRNSAQRDHRQRWEVMSRGILGGLMLMLMLLAPAGVAVAGKPIIDTSYANGKVVYMIGPHVITNPNPKEFAQAEELYIVAYPMNEGGTDTGPKSLPGSGYSPQCNPCYHFGPVDSFAYHDHILSGSPGFGHNGTAGEFKGPWRIILLKYTTNVLNDPSFKPATSAAELEQRILDGQFQLLPGADPATPYELELPVILICPLVAPEA